MKENNKSYKNLNQMSKDLKWQEFGKALEIENHFEN